MNWTDIIVIVIILGNILHGFNKGFITTVIGLAKWFASVILSKMFYVQFTDYVIQNFYDPSSMIQEHVKQFIINMLKIDTTVDIPMTPEQIKTSLEQLKLPDFYSKGISTLQGSVTYTNFVDNIALQLTHIVVYVLGFLVLMLLLMSAFGLIEALANQLAKLPVIREFNKGGGLLIGAVLGLISVYFLMLVLNVFLPFSWSQGMIAAIEQSQFAVYFYKYNILQYFFVSFFNGLYKSFLAI